jgi:ATP-dependent DNA helicase RecQ
VSQWGHDFRADYLRLGVLHELFPEVPRLALTATADARTRAEIVQRLQLTAAQQFVAGFDRPNIRYRIALKHNPKPQLLGFLKDEHPDDAGIVYCLSRKKTEEIAYWLQEQGFKALPYHAGLNARTRADHQSRFLREEGVIIVATIAFGMGIDKPDVRFVAHLDMPKTVESYYQETGRAGRDGEPADAWMIYGLQDVIKLRQMMGGSEGSEEHKRAEQHRLNAMLGLCEITSCRRQTLLNYFGDSLDGDCGNCDTCLEPPNTWDGTEAARMALSAAYRTGQRFGVNHLIDVLRGAETDKIFQFDHHVLPTYGVGKELDNNQWRSVFRQLVARNYLSVDIERFGALRLEAQCRSLLRGDESIQLRRDVKQKSAKRQTKTPLPGDIDVALWEALRERRRRFADEQGVPPYVIFHDRTLQEMCVDVPQTLSEFSRLNGVGERKLEKYGAEFLLVINEHLQTV